MKYEITNFIKKGNNLINFPFSENTKKFALIQKDNWIDSLIQSLRMKKNVEYIIRNGEIIPVDHSNTGTIQKKMIYSLGLHQFLQMKNNLPITNISLTTNYLSNLGYFKRYIKTNGNFIYGLTGTLGSEEARKFLYDVYHMEFDYIPTNRLRILKELTNNISINNENFINNIIRIVK